MNNKRYEYMKEIAEKTPESFAEYFFSDIFNFVFPENYDDRKKLVDESIIGGEKRKSLLMCSSKKEVKHWMNDVASIIIMRLDVNLIISDYLEK